MIPRMVGAVLVLAAAIAAVGTADGAPFSIQRWTVDGGGMGFGQVGAFIVGGSIGQPDAGRLRTGATVVNGGFWRPDGAVPVDVPSGPPPEVALRDAILAATPNPFAASTSVSFTLSAPGRVEARIYDVRGALVRTLEAGDVGAGAHVRAWDARDDSGRPVRPGVYLLRVRIPALRDVQKLVVLR
jgi:hypothetical protein